MAKIFHQPIRMCISCRERFFQVELQRIQCIDGNMSSFSGTGRSIYLCSTCLDDTKRVSKALMRVCRSGEKEKLMNKLKEIITDDRKS